MSKYNTSPLKWAGGKNKALPNLLPILEKHKKPIFVEPFVGAANVSLNFDAGDYVWNDLSSDLMRSYNAMLWDTEDYIRKCKLFFNEYGFEKYNELRDRFNAKTDNSVVSSALFQYLNKHGFNGLCRYNSAGKFNVPRGTVTKKPKNVPEQQIRFLAHRHSNTTLLNMGFAPVISYAQENCLVYSDPPYVPLTSDFKYTADGFGKEQHELLKKLSKESVATCIISNHWTPYTEELYSDADEIYVFDVQRTISCDGGNRKKVQECVVVYKGE